MLRIFIVSLSLLSCLFSLAQDVNQTDAQGRKQGLWKKYYPKTQQLRYEGTFVNDKPKGVFKYYDENNFLTGTVTHIDGVVSYAKNFYESGKLKSEGKFINQKKDSTWIVLREDGTMLSKDNYADDKLNGTSTVYHIEGQPSQVNTYKNGVLNGPSISYYDNGKTLGERNYLEGKIQGAVKTYYLSGALKTQGAYTNDFPSGSWSNYNEDAVLRSIIKYSEKGAVDTLIKMNGVFEEFYGNETVKSSYTYRNGKKDGPFKEFFEGVWGFEDKEDPNTGKKDSIRVLKSQALNKQGSYLNGKLNGPYKEFDKQGKELKNIKYLNGAVAQ